MDRRTFRVFLALALFLVLFPLTLVKPGWPAGLKADEPAYTMMAMSLAHDGDVRVELHDLRRLFNEFSNHPARNVILMTDDGWQTVYYGKPYLYSLAAAPMVRLFGANGLIAFNMLLFLAMVYLGARYLRRFNPEGTAFLFSAGFFFLSAGFAYVFWLQPEVFNMTAITVSLYLGLLEASERWRYRRGFVAGLVSSPGVRVFAAGFVLLLAGYNKPMLVLMGLPVGLRLLAGFRWRDLGLFLAGGTLCLGLAAGGSVALTGHPSAYLGVARAGVKICSPDVMPIAPLPPPPPSTDKLGGTLNGTPEKGSLADERRASWSWLFRLPSVRPAELWEDVTYFLWGRHTGLFLYFPFALLAGLLFLAHARRSAMRWTLIAALVGVGLFFLLWIPFNWHGGGGFIGNRYFVNVYPGFLFLVTRIAPRWSTVVGFAAGGLLLGPILFTPLGRTVAWPTLQAHVRNFPYPHFPLELTIKGIPGYHETTFSGARFRGRQDVFLPRGPRAWVGGATTTELWIQVPDELESFRFEVSSPVAPNEIILEMGEDRERLVFSHQEAGTVHEVVLHPGEPDRVLSKNGHPLIFYRLLVTAETGAVREWVKHFPPRDCFYFPWPETLDDAFFVGAELSYPGTPERLALELYELEWVGARIPARVAAGETFEIRTRVRNTSDVAWPVDPPTRVNLAYHWEDESRQEIVRSGRRTVLEAPVLPGTILDVAQTIVAPDEPGRYVLVLDPVYEGVSWFSDRNDGNVLKRRVEVVPSSDAGRERVEPLPVPPRAMDVSESSRSPRTERNPNPKGGRRPFEHRPQGTGSTRVPGTIFQDGV